VTASSTADPSNGYNRRHAQPRIPAPLHPANRVLLYMRRPAPDGCGKRVR